MPSYSEVIKKRDKYICRLCGCNEKDILEVHHLTPKSLGGLNGRENLITICLPCHHFMHANPMIVLRQRCSQLNKISFEQEKGRVKGRPKGSKDIVPRKTEGYIKRWAKHNQS